MPIPGGTAGAHDDQMHQGSAKRDTANGLAGLGAGGQLLAPGSDIELTRDGSEYIEVVERTSGDIVYRWTRIGANDYECRINCGGVACKILNDSLINAANGIAGLNGSSELAAAQLHMFDTLTEVTGSRATGTVYQNTTDILMIVLVSIFSSAGTTFQAFVENANPPTVRQAVVYESAVTSETQILFLVPAGWYYKLDNSAGTPTIQEWFEVTS